MNKYRDKKPYDLCHSMLWLLQCVLIPSLLLGASSIRADMVPVAVVDFTASGRTPYQTSLPEMVVNELVNSGEFDVLEREKLDTLVGEIAFQKQSGFVSPEQAVEMGGMLGAKLIVTGHVLDHGSETQTYKGYGVTTNRTISRLKARMEVVDVTSGTKIFSNVAEASAERQNVQGTSVDTTEKGLSEAVAKKLVAAMLDSKRIKNIVGGPGLISVPIESEPAEADLEIDGTYYGSVGPAVDLTPGMHEVTVSLPGYLKWSKRVMVKEGSKITARLQPDNTERSESKITVDVVED